jgi:hypothetical protein
MRWACDVENIGQITEKWNILGVKSWEKRDGDIYGFTKGRSLLGYDCASWICVASDWLLGTSYWNVVFSKRRGICWSGGRILTCQADICCAEVFDFPRIIRFSRECLQCSRTWTDLWNAWHSLLVKITMFNAPTLFYVGSTTTISCVKI